MTHARRQDARRAEELRDRASAPRLAGSAHSAMYTGATVPELPIASPITKRPATSAPTVGAQPAWGSRPRRAPARRHRRAPPVESASRDAESARHRADGRGRGGEALDAGRASARTRARSEQRAAHHARVVPLHQVADRRAAETAARRGARRRRPAAAAPPPPVAAAPRRARGAALPGRARENGARLHGITGTSAARRRVARPPRTASSQMITRARFIVNQQIPPNFSREVSRLEGERRLIRWFEQACSRCWRRLERCRRRTSSRWTDGPPSCRPRRRGDPQAAEAAAAAGADRGTRAPRRGPSRTGDRSPRSSSPARVRQLERTVEADFRSIAATIDRHNATRARARNASSARLAPPPAAAARAVAAA